MHAPPDQTNDEATTKAVDVQIVEVFEQREHINENVVVTLHHVDGVAAVGRYPFQSRHALVRQVPIHETN